VLLLYADHRESRDHDHVVADLADRFEMVLEAVEQDEGWATNRVTPGKVILGNLDGIEAGVRQMIRKEPLEALASAIQAQPWGPVARRVEEVLTYSRPYGATQLMERVITGAREEAEAAERESVAAEVDRLVRTSGLSRAEFASRIGTSASRLSTYVTGKVTPSAALLVRMHGVQPASEPLPRWPAD
jgi:DNA-binding transcriptional regulator YiaG